MKYFNRTRFPFTPSPKGYGAQAKPLVRRSLDEGWRNDNKKNNGFLCFHPCECGDSLFSQCMYVNDKQWKQKLVFFVFVSFQCTNVIPGFERESKSSSIFNLVPNSLTEYRAHQAYQSKNFKKSEQEYAKLLANDSYDAQNNYNVGVNLYKQQQFQDALQYFNRAATHAPEKSDLQQQALFNQANSLVSLQQLQAAIKKYEQLLKINPEHEAAKKNLETVKKMLEQQKQEQKQDKKKDKQNKKDQQKNKQDQQNQDQKDQQDSESQDQQSDEEQQKDKAEKQQQKSGKQKEKEQQGSQDAQQKKDQQEKDLEKSKNKDADKRKEQADEKQQENKKLDDALAAELLSLPKNDERLDKRSAALLEKLDDYEKNIQKKLLQLNVTKQGAKQNGQKNW